MPVYCIHCRKPADRRCGNVVALDCGGRLHTSCVHPHLLEVVRAIPEPSSHKRLAGDIFPFHQQPPTRGTHERLPSH